MRLRLLTLLGGTAMMARSTACGSARTEGKAGCELFIAKIYYSIF